MRVLGDLIGPDRDTDPIHPAAPLRSLLVCSTPRSGSGLLCRGLAGTRVAGAPLEYFNPLHRATLTKRWGCGPSLAAYVGALHARRTTPDGTLASKLHWGQLVTLRAEALGVSDAEPEYGFPADFLDPIFPNPTFVRIVRGDVNRQAISLWFAVCSGTWSLAAGDGADDAARRAEVPYSYEGIDRCRRLIENAELHWHRFLRANDIAAVEVSYEQLDTAYVATIESLARRVAPTADVVVAPAPTRRLADRHSEEFRERLARDRERYRLPEPIEALRLGHHALDGK